MAKRASVETRLALLESEVKGLRQDIDSLLRPGPRATQEALWRMREIEREENITLLQERRGIETFLRDAVGRLQHIADLLKPPAWMRTPRELPQEQDLDGFADSMLRLSRTEQDGPKPS